MVATHRIQACTSEGGVCSENHRSSIESKSKRGGFGWPGQKGRAPLRSTCFLTFFLFPLLNFFLSSSSASQGKRKEGELGQAQSPTPTSNRSMDELSCDESRTDTIFRCIRLRFFHPAVSKYVSHPECSRCIDLSIFPPSLSPEPI
jgi:hypothetical protein